ncbi:MAG: kelch repeat-containing protein, partial [Candidatus Limnocylindrales bacterium]
MKRKISQQDLDMEIRSNLAAAGAPEPESLGQVLRALPDRSGASHGAMPAFPGLMRYAALAAVVALAAAAVGLPLMLSRAGPAAASESAETSLVADSSAEPSAWSTDLPSGSPELWSDGPSGSPSEVPSAEPSQVPTATPSTPTSSPSVGPAGLFYSTGSMSRADTGQTATLLHDGRVLITPGNEYDGAPSVEAEVYDPSTGKFSQTYQMTEIVAAPEATLLADGRVLITGGYDPTVNVSTYLRTAELYDPTTNRFTATGSMNAARCGHTATLLKNGRVLIVGGDQLAGATAE